MNAYISDQDIREVYREDTIGRKYHTNITTKKSPESKVEPSEPVTINVNKPMKYDEFKKLNDSLKLVYINSLIENYNITIKDLCEMFGCSYATAHTKIIKKLNLLGLFGKGNNHKTKEQVLKWDSFLYGGENNAVDNTVDAAPVEPNMRLIDFKLILEGKFDVDEVTSKLSALVQNGTPCEITITVTM